MRLAEALARRADLTRRAAELKSRAIRNSRQQEGEEPAEDPAALLAEHDRVLAELEDIVTRVNTTNLATEIEPGATLTAALSRRDALRARHRMRADLADAASQRQDRYTRTELRYVSPLDVPSLRREADDVARQARELDTRIQEVNWTTELLT
ncbi:MAG TPA: DIP1984 family protein [Actinomycetales bacterium]|nr:DIP1984 family protein [Actinomycetales bacterium]